MRTYTSVGFSVPRSRSLRGRFYVGTDGGISRTDDGTVSWTNLDEGIATNLFYAIDIGRGSAANNGFT